MAHFMPFPPTVGKQQEVGVPMKQTNFSLGSHNDHLGSTSTVTLLHNPL